MKWKPEMDTTSDVCVFVNSTRNPRTGDGSLCCWDPQLSYLGTVSCVVTHLVAPLGGVCVDGWNYQKTTGSPVGILVDLGRACSNQSLVQPERVAGSDGLSNT